jgi:hypothetical protein
MGKVEKCGGNHVETMFFYVQMFPIFPLSSHAVVENQGGSSSCIAAPLHLRSVLAAYLRSWGVLAGLISLAMLAGSSGRWLAHGEIALFAKQLLTTTLCVAAPVLGWAVIGRLSREEKAMRFVYQDHLGFALDPATLTPEIQKRMREHLLAFLAQRPPVVTGTNYREPIDPASQWATIALDPATTDAPFLSAAMTLARLEFSLNRGDSRQPFAQLHRDLWAKIKGLHEVYLDAAAVG